MFPSALICGFESKLNSRQCGHPSQSGTGGTHRSDRAAACSVAGSIRSTQSRTRKFSISESRRDVQRRDRHSPPGRPAGHAVAHAGQERRRGRQSSASRPRRVTCRVRPQYGRDCGTKASQGGIIKACFHSFGIVQSALKRHPNKSLIGHTSTLRPVSYRPQERCAGKRRFTGFIFLRFSSKRTTSPPERS